MREPRRLGLDDWSSSESAKNEIASRRGRGMCAMNAHFSLMLWCVQAERRREREERAREAAERLAAEVCVYVCMYACV